nr:RNA-directed DNA polymerase, eukaryota [Tanacetum cinerariifolium]
MLDLISNVQSAFVSNSQILNGPFSLNELLSWCKYKKVNAMIFKVEFEKAFDSIRWDYLDDVLNSFGFGEKWQSWINYCLSSSMGSVLVNGNPTSKSHFHTGLKQGDPLSPFLFILVMESLHLSFNRVLDVGLYKGISVSNSLMISHLFYADDAIFIGKWDPSNIKTIMHILKCFYLASGLKINPQKGKLMGIGVNKEEVDSTAAIVGCATFSTPVKYLGVQVGANMSWLSSWHEVEAKISSRLSRWKLKTLSIREVIRRNLFNGMERSERKIAWISWDKILESKKYRGSSLWSRFIKAIHGVKGAIDNHVSTNRNSIWLNIVRDIYSLKQKGIDLLSFVRKKVSDGESSLFWDDTWLGEATLKMQYPRLYALELHAAIALAVHNEFSLAYHVVCYRHLMMNLSLKRDKTKVVFRKICKAYTTKEFSSSMSHLQDIQLDVYDKLCQVGPQRWSRAHCPLVHYNYLTSNSVESVNACTVVYRKLPVLKLAETYRAMVQDWYYKSRKLVENMTYEITDWAANKVQKNDKNAKWGCLWC